MKVRNFEISYHKRTSPVTGRQAIGIRILFFLLGLLFLGVFLFFMEIDPIALYTKMLRVSILLFPSTLVIFITLACIAVGLAVPFKARVDNIGAEGQYIMGSIAGAATAYLFPTLPTFILVPLMFINGFIIGALWAVPVAVFRAKGGFQGSDVVVSFLLVFPALYIMEYLVSGPWRDTETGFARSEPIPTNARIPTLDFLSFDVPFLDVRWRFSSVHITIFLVLFLTLLIYYLLFRYKDGIPTTTLGYEINVMGNNPEAGRMAGLSFFKTVLFAMLLSGGFAGIAGVGELAGNKLNLFTYSEGYGYTAIAVAYLGGLNPIGILFSALFFAALIRGGTGIEQSGTIDLFSGTILFFVLLSEFFFRYTIEVRLHQDG